MFSCLFALYEVNCSEYICTHCLQRLYGSGIFPSLLEFMPTFENIYRKYNIFPCTADAGHRCDMGYVCNGIYSTREHIDVCQLIIIYDLTQYYGDNI